MGSWWCLEHVTTRDRFLLSKGENSIGRHSCCKIVIRGSYDFVSREHAMMTVSDSGVVVQSMNAINGVFINRKKIMDNISKIEVVDGSVIGLGVDAGHKTAVPANYPIFVLRKVVTEAAEEVLLSSDDDDDVMPLKDRNLCNLSPLKRDTREEHPLSSILHLPQISETKQEILSHTTEEITNVFGKPDEVIFGSVININPYLFNELNKQSGGIAPMSSKIHHGDVIDLNTDANRVEMQPPEPTESVDDEYDEQLAISQAVLQGMKAEMAFSDGEEDFLSSNDVLCSPPSQVNDDDIIIINSESDDDELYDKVADWSNKLLRKRDTDPMSRRPSIFSETDQENRDPDRNSKSISGTRKSPTWNNENKFTDNIEAPKRQPSARLCNRSKSCYTERPIHLDENLGNKDIQKMDTRKELVVTQHAPENPNKTPARRNTIHSREKGGVKAKESEKNIKRVTQNKEDEPGKVAEPPAKNRSARLQNRSRSCLMENKVGMDSREELVATQRAPENPNKTPARRKTIHSREEGGVKAKESEKNGKSVSQNKEDEPEKVAKHSAKNRSARLQNRSRSCLMENKVEMDTREELVVTLHATEQPEKSPARKPMRTRRNTIHYPEESKKSEKNAKRVMQNKQDQDEPGDVAETPAKRSRSRSCYMERPVEIDEPLASKQDITKKQSETCSKNHYNSKEKTPLKKSLGSKSNKTYDSFREMLKKKISPSTIKPPLMAANRRKTIDHPRLVDPDIKQKRREALKKLSDKAKDGENNPSSSNSTKKKNCTTVPKLSNTNRGEFLTRGIDSGPPAKMAKRAEKHKVTTPPDKNSIETCSQQILTADDPAEIPQPHCSRLPELREEQLARNQRTCSRDDFADLERERQRAKDAEKIRILQRQVHFSDKNDIKYVEVCGANNPVGKSKDSTKICLSSYRERRDWTLKGSNMVNDIGYQRRTILTWANQWLELGSVDAAAETDALMPILSDFTCLKQYRNTFLPLIKLELLTTIEREYKSSKTTLNLEVTDVFSGKEFYRIVAKTNARPIGKFELYTLSSGTEMAETFASLLEQKAIGGSVWFMTFEIWMQVSLEKMKSLKQLTARPLVDSLRVELGSLSAIQQLHRSPLSRRILKPTEAVQTFDISQAFSYMGFTKLNKQQENICLSIYKRVLDDGNPSITLVQGPPGTGKSTLLSNLSLQCLYGRASLVLDRKILICAHSNTAVDHIVNALSKALFAMSQHHFHLLRFGITEKMSENSLKFSVENQRRKLKNERLKRLTPESIETLKKQHCDLKAEIQKLEQNSKGASVYLQNVLKEKQKQLLLISEQLNPPLTQREEFDIAEMCVKRAHIVCTTLSSCVKLANYVDFFDICIIDDATECTEPWTLLPMRFGINHLVLVGGTQQQPAVVLSKKAIDFGLGHSMFDRIQKSLVKHLDMDQPGGSQLAHTKLFKLSTQYRMHPEICRWPNKYFYEDQLQSAYLPEMSSPLIPYCVINLSYTRDTSDSGGNKSISNAEEARFVAQLLAEMDKHMPSQRYSYGLISPYSSQCHALSKVIPRHMKLTPKTVDSYQGLEKDVIVISIARTRRCSFLANYQRLNVALTRSRRCLIICGNFNDLQSVEMWRQLLDDARQRKVYFDLKRDEVNDLKRSVMSKLVKPREAIVIGNDH